MTRSFGLDAPSAFEELTKAAKRFKQDELDADLARDCAGKAWHLCDHVFKVLSPNPTFQDLKDFQRQVRTACPELGYLQDICIESKHAEITKYSPRIDEALVHTGDFSNEDFSGKDFDTSRLEIRLRGGGTVLFNNALERAVEFWSTYLERHGIR